MVSNTAGSAGLGRVAKAFRHVKHPAFLIGAGLASTGLGTYVGNKFGQRSGAAQMADVLHSYTKKHAPDNWFAKLLGIDGGSIWQKFLSEMQRMNPQFHGWYTNR